MTVASERLAQQLLAQCRVLSKLGQMVDQVLPRRASAPTDAKEAAN
jgi:hypothetical protein